MNTEMKIEKIIVPFVFLLISGLISHFTYPLLNDTYFHMATGREVVSTKKIPTQDNFVYSMENTKYTSTEWASGLIFFIVYERFNEIGLLMVKIMMITLTLFFVFRSLRIFTKNYYAIGNSLLVLGYILITRFDTRPEIFSFVFLSLINYVCLHFYFKEKISRFIYFLPLIFLIWPNIHGFSPIGLGLIGFFVLTVFVRKMFMRTEEKIFIGVFILSTAVSLLQWERFFFFTQASNFSDFIFEWMSLKDRLFPNPNNPNPEAITIDVISYLIILPLYFITLLSVVKKEDKKILIPNLFYILLLVFSIKYYRLIQPTVLLSFPMLYVTLCKAFSNIKLKWLHISIFIFFAIVYLLSFVIGQPILGRGIDGNSPFETNPKTAQFIEKHLDTKHIFTFGSWTDYFIWRLPGKKVFSDVMYQYRSKESLQNEAMLHNPDFDPTALLAKYDIDTVVSTNMTDNWVSKTAVGKLSGWELVYIDNKSLVYARKDIINNKPLDLSEINLEATTAAELTDKEIKQIEALLVFEPANGFALNRLMLYTLNVKKDKARAYELAENARRLVPNDPNFSYILAVFEAELGNCPKAELLADEAIAKSKNDQTIKNLTENLIISCR